MSLDAEVATRVMGWQLFEPGSASIAPYWRSLDNVAHIRNQSDWNPSISIADAWLVVEEMRRRGAPVFARFCDELMIILYAKHGYPEPEIGHTPTPLEMAMYWMGPEDICLASLEAIK